MNVYQKILVLLLCPFVLFAQKKAVKKTSAKKVTVKNSSAKKSLEKNTSDQRTVRKRKAK